MMQVILYEKYEFKEEFLDNLQLSNNTYLHVTF